LRSNEPTFGRMCQPDDSKLHVGLGYKTDHVGGTKAILSCEITCSCSVTKPGDRIGSGQDVQRGILENHPRKLGARLCVAGCGRACKKGGCSLRIDGDIDPMKEEQTVLAVDRRIARG
jgi:hypothetical protein